MNVFTVTPSSLWRCWVSVTSGEYRWWWGDWSYSWNNLLHHWWSSNHLRLSYDCWLRDYGSRSSYVLRRGLDDCVFDVVFFLSVWFHWRDTCCFIWNRLFHSWCRFWLWSWLWLWLRISWSRFWGWGGLGFWGCRSRILWIDCPHRISCIIRSWLWCRWLGRLRLLNIWLDITGNFFSFSLQLLCNKILQLRFCLIIRHFLKRYSVLIQRYNPWGLLHLIVVLHWYQIWVGHIDFHQASDLSHSSFKCWVSLFFREKTKQVEQIRWFRSCEEQSWHFISVGFSKLLDTFLISGSDHIARDEHK